MWMQTFFKSLTSTSTRRRQPRRSSPASRLCLEPLEERCLLSFGVPVEYDLGIGPSIGGPVTADFNADGRRLDIAATGASGVAVLLGNGDGTFQAARYSETGAGPGSVQAGDLNNDSRTDLVTIDASGVRALLGNGDGTFQPPQVVVLPSQVPPASPTLYPGSQTPVLVALGDLNADGNLDLVVTVVAQHSVVIGYIDIYDEYTGGIITLPLLEQHNVNYLNVLLGSGNGAFGPASVTALGENKPQGALQLGDFTGDGRLDVLTSFLDYLNDLYVMPGNGDGSLQAARKSTVGGYVRSTAGDFDGDGKQDLVVQNWGIGAAGVARGNGDGTFGLLYEILDPATMYDTPFSTATFAAVGDIDADGNLDIVGSFSFPEYLDYMAVLLGDGNGSFSLAHLTPEIVLSGNPVELLADFDANGFPDLVWSQNRYGGSGAVVVAWNDGIWMPQPPPPPTITISDVTVTEGNTATRAASFTVTLSATSSQTVTVAYATANDGSATNGSDYQVSAGTLIIPAGQTTGTITVLVNGDRLGEPVETFVVNLSGPTNATIADGQGVGTIVDDEPRIIISDVAKAEGRRNRTTLFTFTVTLSAAYDQPVTMSFRTVDGTAKTGDNDYIAKTGTLTFAPGETTKTITIEVKGDSKKEANETFYLDLFAGSGNSLFTKNRGIGTILNDD